MNLQKFYMGESFDAYEYFGAHPEDGGVVFRTYAPKAHGITLVGEFNGWKEEPLTQIHQSGVWVGFSRVAKPGQMYKYVIYGQNGRVEHCDPYGFPLPPRSIQGQPGKIPVSSRKEPISPVIGSRFRYRYIPAGR